MCLKDFKFAQMWFTYIMNRKRLEGQDISLPLGIHYILLVNDSVTVQKEMLCGQKSFNDDKYQHSIKKNRLFLIPIVEFWETTLFCRTFFLI